MRKRFQDLLNIKKKNNLTQLNQQLHITFDITIDNNIQSKSSFYQQVRPSLIAVKKKKIQKKTQQKQSKKTCKLQNVSSKEQLDNKIYESITKDQFIIEAETTTCFTKQDQLTRRNSIKQPSNNFENEKLKSQIKTIQIPLNEILFNEFQRKIKTDNNKKLIKFQQQREINSKMRSILVKWLYQVALSFKFKAESFFLAIHILDKYTQTIMIKRDEYQLIGITALFMAGKVEEIYPPKIRQYVTLGQQSYNKEQMLQKEFEIITALNFKINFKSTYSILSLLKIVGKFDQKTMDTALFLANAGLMKSHACTQNYDTHAIGALYLACQLNNQQILFEKLQSFHWFPSQQFVCQAKEFQTSLNLKSCFQKFFSFMQSKPNYRSYLFKI